MQLCHARGEEEEARAVHYFAESYLLFPADIDVISWLGAYHVKNEVYEKAIPLFEQAAKLQTHEVKWELMLASCYRRIGAYSTAIDIYRSVHSRHPENVECLR